MSAGPADKALDVFKDMVFDPLVEAASSMIIALAPWLAIAPVAFIVRYVVGYVSGVLYGLLKDAINVEVILLNNAAHHAAFVDASIALNRIAKKQGVDSPEFKAAREKHKKNLAAFVRYSGT